jgi:ubiquitin C
MQTGRAIVLNVSPTDRIEEVKEAIQEKDKIPVDRQMLVFSGKVLEDGSTLQDYSIRRDSVLHLSLRIHTVDSKRIYVQMPAGTKISLRVHPNCKINDLKRMIQAKEGISVEKQKLSSDEKLLADNETVDHYSIGQDSTIKLTLK